MSTNEDDAASLGGPDYFNVPNILTDTSHVTAEATSLYVYLCSVAARRGTRVLSGNVIEEFMRAQGRGAQSYFTSDTCFDALYELTFPRTELGGKSYVSIEFPFYRTAEEDEEDARHRGRTRRVIHLNDISGAKLRHARWQAHLEEIEE